MEHDVCAKAHITAPAESAEALSIVADVVSSPPREGSDEDAAG